jgi:hypothetical protein
MGAVVMSVYDETRVDNHYLNTYTQG